MRDGGEGRGREGLGQVIVRSYRCMYSDYVLTMYEVLPMYFLGAEPGRSPNLTRKFIMMIEIAIPCSSQTLSFSCD